MSNIQNTKPKFSVAIRSDAYQNLINSTLGDKELARQFVADITSVVSANPLLSSCDAGSILSAGLMASSLKLPLANSLGFAYIIPYGDKAQFQIGYKGLIQLAQRSGQFERIGVREVHDGEYAGQDEFGEDLFKFSHDFDKNEVVGYFAYFKLLNGFTKTLYMTKEQCLAHGRKYSKSFNSSGKTNVWRDLTDAMCQKTVLKLLLNKYAPLSVELQKAVVYDQASIRENGTPEYVDNSDESTELRGIKKTIVDEDETVINETELPSAEKHE